MYDLVSFTTSTGHRRVKSVKVTGGRTGSGVRVRVTCGGNCDRGPGTLGSQKVKSRSRSGSELSPLYLGSLPYPTRPRR